MRFSFETINFIVHIKCQNKLEHFNSWERYYVPHFDQNHVSESGQFAGKPFSDSLWRWFFGMHIKLFQVHQVPFHANG